MSFKKVVENFTCEHCKAEVIGDGFTNHCPVCLWSKHVDIDPGDRSAECGGMMEPYDVDVVKDVFRILHKCMICGYERKCPVTMKDDFSLVLLTAQRSAKRKADLLM